MTKGAHKGSDFERQICRDLSLWWSEGQRDDIFWRTSGSGARATTRRKAGKSTRNQDGDVGATDAAGEALLDCVHIEIKRGYNEFEIGDFIESPKRKYTFWSRLEEYRKRADSVGKTLWFISKRDFRETLISTDIDGFLSKVIGNSLTTFRYAEIGGWTDDTHTFRGWLIFPFCHLLNIEVDLVREALGCD